MKLRNKKTGEIIEVESLDVDSPTKGIVGIPSFDRKGSYNSLAELNEEWCDYEEPKSGIKDVWFPDVVEGRNNVVISFETREEAELAVCKLKAWKRLKDKGFRFTGINDDEDSQELITQCGILCEADIYHLEKDADFLLIFGGEE